MDGLSFEIVDKDIPPINISFEDNLLEEPPNLSFEEKDFPSLLG
ncbi:hypothetical protein [Rubeoparvulum massiliense]|nr:hypothetical protein [Rubeoparvulum massiliense]